MVQKDQLVLKIYKYLDEDYLVPEIADMLDITEERVWQIIEDVEKEDEPRDYDIPRMYR